MVLKDKVVLITGATGGIGRATVLKFAQEKASLIFTYNQKNSSLTDLEEKLTKSNTPFSSIQVDLAKLSDIKNLFSLVKEKYKNIDILVNMAGIEPSSNDPLDTQVWKKVFDVNLFAPVECIREAVKYIREGGVVINISSVAGKTGTTYDFSATSYAVSKAALSKLTEVCAYQFAPKIRFVSIEPGYVKTSMWGDLTKEKEDIYANKVPIKRFILPEEVSNLIVSVCQNDALNGQSFTIDGGLSLKYLL